MKSFFLSILVLMMSFSFEACSGAPMQRTPKRSGDETSDVFPVQPQRLPLTYTHTDQTTTGNPVYAPTAQTTTGGPVYVHGYTRANGTYVAPHTRRR
jgi:hypothetical protein